MSKWNTDNIPNQDGKVVIVTGANTGLGFEDTLALSSKGAKVVMACRDLEKGNSAIAKIKDINSNAKLDLIHMDLESLSSVKKFTDEFLSNYDQLDLLINNAGVMRLPYAKTEAGFERQIGINHFGHFALTGWLLPRLMESKNSRVVNVSSLAHRQGNIDFEDIDWEKRDYDPSQAYSDSKLANLYFTYELARRLGDRSPMVVASHPGFSATDLLDHTWYLTMKIPGLTQSAARGALPTLLAATGDDVKAMDYFGPNGKGEMKGDPVKVESTEISHDKELAKKLWELSEERTGVVYQF